MSKKIAALVLGRASEFDRRMPVPNESVVSAWGGIFEGKVWESEALAAVADHYAKPNAFPLMPGDVIAYCQAQPVWSSAEHAREFLRKWCQHPYSGAIGMQAGIEEPLFAIPESVVRDDHKKYLIHRLNAWVSENEQMLIDNILEKKLNPW
ncbi:hypothetical protein [Rhodococcus erythropolis]|uniref:hypothetical protein n=1 Tax=Rhodococcus erythropolis TaxID=1833 RepID=UPI003670069D